MSVATGALMLSAPANALILKLESNAQTITVLNNGAGDGMLGDLPGTNHITFNGSVGDFAVNIDSTLSNLPSGSAPATMELNIHAGSVGAGTIKLSATEVGFSVPDIQAWVEGTFSLTKLQNEVVGSVTGGLVAYEIWIDDGNNPFGLGVNILNSSTNTSPDVDLAQMLLGLGQPYSITQILTITHNASGGTSQAQLAASVDVPEPMTLGLFGLGLLGAGLARRRKAA